MQCRANGARGVRRTHLRAAPYMQHHDGTSGAELVKPVNRRRVELSGSAPANRLCDGEGRTAGCSRSSHHDVEHSPC